MTMVVRKILEEGMTYRQASKIFNVSHGSIYVWIKNYKNQTTNGKRRERKSKYDEQVQQFKHDARVRELKQEIAELYLENTMLKKALEHSVRLKKLNSSVVTPENLDQLQELAK